MGPNSIPPPLPATATGPISADPLTSQHQAELAQAQRSYRPIRRAARTARFSAITTLIIGLSAAACTAFSPDVTGVVCAVALCTIGVIEFVGHRRLLRGEPGAAQFLMRNQLAFLALICLYCVIQMVSFSVVDLKNQALPPEVRSQLAPMPEVTHMIDHDVEVWGTLAHYGLYTLVLVLSIVFQGGLAFYYATRRKHLESFRRTNPPWARQLLHQLG